MQAPCSTDRAVRLADIFSPASVLIGLENRTKQGSIRELVHHLVRSECVEPATEASLVELILAREKQATTGANGLAIPHCRTTGIARFTGAIAVDPRGIAFDAIDGDPVHVMFLLIAPLELRETHFEILGKLAAIGRDKGLRYMLRNCRSPEAVHDFLTELDRR